MFKGSGNPVANRLSIDLGGYHTRIYQQGTGLLLDEPSVGLLDMDTQNPGSDAVACYGSDALERAPTLTGTRLIRPLQADCRSNLGYSAKMLRYFLSKLRRTKQAGKSPVVLLIVPQEIPQHLSDDLKHACFTAGASRVHLVDHAIAAAVGTGLEIADATPRLLMDVGARNARLHAFQHNEIQFTQALPLGGNKLDEVLANGIRERYGIHVSEADAQNAKHRVGSAMPSSFGLNMRNSCQMQGQQILENTRTNFTLTSEVACEMLQPAMQRAAQAIHTAFGAMPSEFRNSPQDLGIMLTGGGTKLTQLDQLIMEAANLPVETARHPLSAAVRGGAIMLERIHGAVAEPEPA